MKIKMFFQEKKPSAREIQKLWDKDRIGNPSATKLMLKITAELLLKY